MHCIRWHRSSIEVLRSDRTSQLGKRRDIGCRCGSKPVHLQSGIADKQYSQYKENRLQNKSSSLESGCFYIHQHCSLDRKLSFLFPSNTEYHQKEPRIWSRSQGSQLCKLNIQRHKACIALRQNLCSNHQGRMQDRNC